MIQIAFTAALFQSRCACRKLISENEVHEYIKTSLRRIKTKMAQCVRQNFSLSGDPVFFLDHVYYLGPYQSLPQTSDKIQDLLYILYIFHMFFIMSLFSHWKFL